MSLFHMRKYITPDCVLQTEKYITTYSSAFHMQKNITPQRVPHAETFNMKIPHAQKYNTAIQHINMCFLVLFNNMNTTQTKHRQGKFHTTRK